MKFVLSFVILSCALFEARGYPYAYYPSYGNVDSLSYGDGNRGGMALSRYYNPYYNQRAVGGGMAAFMYRQPEAPQQSGQYYLPDRRRQTQQEANFVPPQQNEVAYPQQPDNQAFIPSEATELAEPTENVELAPVTEKAVAVPEFAEPEIKEVAEEAPVQKAKKVSKKKQVKRPVDDEDEEEYAPRMPAGAFFPMFFGYGGRGAGGAGGPGGPMAVANAYSTGKGGVATSHATAYGAPRPEERV
ncbi:uncharacterized protein LOC118278713 [Spodoptera frugiperda]|uniref:Uncharacterized protein LOC118278713 n=1 Tax=Spodoptera frugiperda TaxID=7108 RepID=A0A9R0DHL1_SPOFR|nr:uncharacterized protein LOC118278713 [Spodoptera frugiperda]